MHGLWWGLPAGRSVSSHEQAQTQWWCRPLPSHLYGRPPAECKLADKVLPSYRAVLVNLCRHVSNHPSLLLLTYLLDQLRSSILDRIFQGDGASNGDAIVDDLRHAVLLLKDDIAACKQVTPSSSCQSDS